MVGYSTIQIIKVFTVILMYTSEHTYGHSGGIVRIKISRNMTTEELHPICDCVEYGVIDNEFHQSTYCPKCGKRL